MNKFFCFLSYCFKIYFLVAVSSFSLSYDLPKLLRLDGIAESLIFSLLNAWQLSPCQLLEIREKFRQRPRQDLSHVNYEDVEGYFGVLITLYYIHKLLSSHGIRPAHEMLERKLKQGYTSYLQFIYKLS